VEEKRLDDINKIAGAVEAILFVAGDPIERSTITHALEITDLQLSRAIEVLESELDFNMRGLKLMQYSNKLQLCTRPEYADFVERALNPAPRQTLSNTLLETLSVIAYKQPVTKQEIETVRGVKCDYSVSVLTKLGLIYEAGRKETLGRPIMYGTTDEFLRHFGIASLDDLPTLDLESGEFDAPV